MNIHHGSADVSFAALFVLFTASVPLSAAERSAPKPFIVTAYCQHGITKSGLRTVPGGAAGDPAYLPLGSVVGIATGAPAGDLEIYTVTDTGGKVKGHHLDVFTPDCGRAKQFGRRLRQLTIFRFGWHSHLQIPHVTRPASPWPSR